MRESNQPTAPNPALGMNKRRRHSWLEPIGFRAPRALAELRITVSRLNWLRITIVCSLFGLSAVGLVRRYVPEAEVDWLSFLARGLGVLGLAALAVALAMLIPRFVSFTSRGIVVQHGQTARIYRHGAITDPRVETDGAYTVLRFHYDGRGVELGLSARVSADVLLEELRMHQMTETRQLPNKSSQATAARRLASDRSR